MEKKINGIDTISTLFGVFKWICLFVALGCLFFAYIIKDDSLVIAGISLFISTLPLWCLEKFFYALYIIALGSFKQFNK